jgi:hypothetical protein
MTKADGIRGPGIQQPTLQQKESQQVKQQQKGQVSSQDAARIAQQAGFARADRKKGKKGSFDIGDSSRSPIPLPDDDIDGDAWSGEKLDGAQQSLGLASAQFGELAALDDDTEVSIGAASVGGSFMPTEDSIADLEDLAKRPAPEPLPMDEVTTNVERLFNIKLDEEVPLGQKILATGLVVAGEAGSVDVGGGKLDEKKLAGGLQKVTERSNQAVGEAQKMNKGITTELNVQRTFVFKR